MKEENLNYVRSKMRCIADFPKPGINFIDVMPLFADAEAFAKLVDETAELYKSCGITKVVGLEARGFIMGSALATKLGAGFVTMRKPGKLPYEVRSIAYKKEYGEDVIEIHSDAIVEDDVVLLYDDVLATGGTLDAAYKLLKSFNPKSIYTNVTLEIAALKGRTLLTEKFDLDSMFEV